MNTLEKYKISVSPFENSEVEEILDFADIPLLYVEVDSIGKLYLNYLDRFIDEHLEQRFVVPISEQRLNALKKGTLSVGEAFCHPETPLIFVTHVSQLDGEIKQNYLLPDEVFQTFNSVSTTYFLSLEEEPVAAKTNLVKGEKLLVEIGKFFEEQKFLFNADEMFMAQKVIHLLRERISLSGEMR
jgi:hypothetical protein